MDILDLENDELSQANIYNGDLRSLRIEARLIKTTIYILWISVGYNSTLNHYQKISFYSTTVFEENFTCNKKNNFGNSLTSLSELTPY